MPGSRPCVTGWQLGNSASSPAVDRAAETYDTLSEAVLADLLNEYDSVVDWQRRPDACHRLHRGPADMPVERFLSDIQALVGWPPGLLAELDDLHTGIRERLAEETAAYRPQSIALSLF